MSTQASQSTLDKLLVLQKRAIRLINFSPKCEHTIPFLGNLNILPVHFLYVESLSCLMHDVQNKLSSCSYSKFIYSCLRYPFHSYNTISATTNKFYVMSSRLEQLKHFPDLACGFEVIYLKSASRNLFKKYMKHLLIFLNKRITLLQFLK